MTALILFCSRVDLKSIYRVKNTQDDDEEEGLKRV
jgi:hypothetical protein